MPYFLEPIHYGMGFASRTTSTHSSPIETAPTMKLTINHKSTKPQHALTVGALLCLGVFPSSNLFAQTAIGDLKEIIVQSGRLEQKQFDAPASIFTIDSDTLRASGPQVNISDVLSSAPGVVALNRNNYAQDVQISIRGFGSRAAFGLRGIRLITDGIPASMPDGQGQASTISMTSTDRMEVLTGPLALMYGNGSGGVIQTFTREAGDKPEAQVNLYAGSFGMQRTDWQISQRTGNVGLVADYSTFSTHGYRDHSAAERKQLNSVITVDAKPDTRFKFIINTFDMPSAQDPLGVTKAGLNTPDKVVSGATDNNTRKTVKQEQVGAVIEHTVNSDLRFQGRMYGGTRSNLQYQATFPAGWTGLERRYEGLGLQANGKTQVFDGQRVTWSAGVDYDHAQEQRQAGLTTNGEKSLDSNGHELTRNELNQATNRDYFAQANWSLSERYTLTTGIRQSDVTLKSRDDYPTTGPGSDADGSGSVHYKATSPVLGLTWHAQDNLNLYANHGKGFETPTLSETAYQTGANNTINPAFNKSLLASRSKHLELGSKWRPTSATRIDAAWFRITTENEIVTNLSSGGKTSYANAPSTLRDGFELALRTQHSSNWRSQVSATVMNASYEDAFTSTSVKSGKVSTTTIPAGNSLPAIPKQQLFASVQWSEKGFALAGQKPALGLEAGLDWIHRSSMWAGDINSSTDGLAPGYDLLNARVRQRYQVGPARIETFVGIDNLANKNTVSSVIVNQSSSQYFEPGLPRAWIVGVQSQIPL
jgi:iron complex outermembrane receptor protein